MAHIRKEVYEEACPNCGVEDNWVYDRVKNEEYINEFWGCDKCGQEWLTVYKFISTEYDKEEENE